MRFRLLICLLLVAAPLMAADLHGLTKELNEKYSALAKDDVEGRRKLAKWCHAKKMRQSELRLYREVVKLAPDDEDAHKQLGHVHAEDGWYPSVGAMHRAHGDVKLLTEWVEPDKAPDGSKLVHDYRLTQEQFDKLETGEALQAHARDDWHEVITREYVITSRLKVKETLELARMLEQAVRAWREDANLPYDAVNAISLEVDILKDHEAFLDMIESDIESFDDDMKKSQGFFDGRTCRMSYFHDWYRTRRVMLHEGRHQFDSLVAQKIFQMPAWYKEGTAEYWSMHEWDGKTLKMGQLVPDVNYSLWFCRKLLKKRKINGAEDTLNQDWWGVVDPEFYQNSWAFVYYLKHSDSAEGFKKFESELLEGKLNTQAKQLEAFKRLVNKDLKKFDKAYKKQLEDWAEQSPEDIR